MLQQDTATRPRKRRLSKAFGREEPPTQLRRRVDLSATNQHNPKVNHDGKETQISEHLCSVCFRIDWNRILHHSTKEKRLGYLDECTSLTCPICHIIRASIKEHWKLDWPTSTAKIRPQIYVQSKLWYSNWKDETEPDLYRAILALTCKPPKLKLKRRRLLDVDKTENRFIFCELELNSPLRISIEPHLDISKTRSWIQDSRESVRGSTRSAGSLFRRGFRLIDVEDECLVMRTDPCEYSALSYVWGSLDPFALKTTMRNFPDLSRLHALRRGPSFNGKRLQGTIADSIKLTKEIGLRYLWVDALCIVQDDMDEKQRLIHGMNQVYENATVTIIAPEGSHADSGLPGIRPRKLKLEERVFNVSTAQYSIRLAKARESLIGHVRRGAWTERAWTYQELSLSHSRLFMCDTEAFFDHSDKQFREGYQLAYPGRWSGPAYWNRKTKSDVDPSRFINLASKEKPDFQSFSECVASYTRKSLSFPADTLHAFSGIYKKFSSRHDDDNYDPGILKTHGIPVQFFPEGICWFPEMSTSGIVRVPFSGARWSWTVSKRPVEFVSQLQSNFKGSRVRWQASSLVDFFHLCVLDRDTSPGMVHRTHATSPRRPKLNRIVEILFRRVRHSLEKLVSKEDLAISQLGMWPYAISLSPTELGFGAYCFTFVESFFSVFAEEPEGWWRLTENDHWFRFDDAIDEVDKLVISLWDGSLVAIGVKAEDDAWVRVGIASLHDELIGWGNPIEEGRIHATWEYIKLR